MKSEAEQIKNNSDNNHMLIALFIVFISVFICLLMASDKYDIIQSQKQQTEIIIKAINK